MNHQRVLFDATAIVFCYIYATTPAAVQAALTRPLSDQAVPVGETIIFTYASDVRDPDFIKELEFNHNITNYVIASRFGCVEECSSCSWNKSTFSDRLSKLFEVRIHNAQPNNAGTYFVKDDGGLAHGQTSYAQCVVYYGTPEYRVTMSSRIVSIEWNFVYWGNANISVSCVTSQGRHVFDVHVNDTSRRKQWTVDSQPFINIELLRCRTAILPSSRCHRCNISYEHQSTVHISSPYTIGAVGRLGDLLTVLPNNRSAKHGDVLTCSYRADIHTAVTFLWLTSYMTSSHTVHKTIHSHKGHQYRLDVCRVPVAAQENVWVTATCLAVTENEVLESATRTYSLTNDVTKQRCTTANKSSTLASEFDSGKDGYTNEHYTTMFTVFAAVLATAVACIVVVALLKRRTATKASDTSESTYSVVDSSTRNGPRSSALYDHLTTTNTSTNRQTLQPPTSTSTPSNSRRYDSDDDYEPVVESSSSSSLAIVHRTRSPHVTFSQSPIYSTVPAQSSSVRNFTAGNEYSRLHRSRLGTVF